MNATLKTVGYVLVAALLAAVMLVGCSGPAAAPTTPEATVSTATTPKPSTSSTSAAPKVLTRAEAGGLYLAKVANPLNSALDADPKCRKAEDFLIDGGEWYGTPPAWKVLQACHKRYIPVYNAADKVLETAAWPADAKADVAELLEQDRAFVGCFKRTTRAKTSAESDAALYCFPEDSGVADKVRARFGLKGRDR